jgi:hypothetical protein
VELRLVVGAQAAKRLGIATSHGTATIGTARVTGGAAARVKLRLSKSARAKLLDARSFQVTVRAAATSGAERAAAARSLRLER